MRKFLPIILSLSMVWTACSRTPTEPEEGGGNETPPTSGYSMYAMVYKTGTASGAFAKVYDSTGALVSDAIITINGTSLTYYYGAYYSNDITYSSGQTYNLVAIIDGDTFTASATAPQIDDVQITSPDSGATFLTGSEIPVNWQYVGGSNDKSVMVMLYNNDVDSTVYYSDILNGSTVAYTIPSSATGTPGNYSISVAAGEISTISGLSDPDPADGINGSFFAVFTEDIVDISIGDTSGGGTPTDVSGTWYGGWQSLMNADSTCNADTLILDIPSVDADGNFSMTMDGGCAGILSGSGTAVDYTITMNVSYSGATINYDGQVNTTIDSMGGVWKVYYGTVVVDSGLWWVRK